MAKNNVQQAEQYNPQRKLIMNTRTIFKVRLIVSFLLLMVSAAFAVQFDVSDYGARPDGVTNNASAIQAAINAAQSAGGGTVFFPPGKAPYIVRSTITIKGDNITLLGYDATIKMAYNRDTAHEINKLILANGADKLTIAGLTLDGNSKSQQQLGYVLLLRDVKGGLIKDCHLKSAVVVMHFARDCSDIISRDCLVSDWFHDAYSLTAENRTGSCHDITYLNCHAIGSFGKGRDGAWEFEDGVQNVWVIDCSVQNANGNGFTVKNHTTWPKPQVTRNINYINCYVTNVTGKNWYLHSRTETNVVRDITLINCSADGRLVMLNDLQNVVISGGRFSGLELGVHNNAKTPLKNFRIDNIQANKFNIWAEGIDLTNVSVHAEGDIGIKLKDGCRDVKLDSCTITGAKKVGIDCGNVPAVINNCFLWDNAVSIAVNGGAGPILTGCHIEGGVPSQCRDGGGNVTIGSR